jgi:glycosyltransferase involved in cell wall biosynthesis
MTYCDKKSKKVLFVVPRIHTNMLGMLEGFIELGFEINIVSIDPSANILRNHPQIKIISAGTLSTISLFFLVSDMRPTLVILRSSNKYTRQIGRICFFKRFSTVVYEQTAALRCIGLKHAIKDIYQFLKRFVLFFQFKSVSPIKKDSGGPKCRALCKEYFTFPISRSLLRMSNIKDDSFTVIIVGKLNQERKQLREGLIAVRNSGIQGKLVIIGEVSSKLIGQDNSQEMLLEEASKVPSTLKVEIISSLTHEEALKMIAKSHVLLLSSKNEPFSVSPLEAMALGTVPIVPETNGSSFLIQNGIEGYLYPDSHWSKVSEILSSLFHDRQKLERISTLAIERMQGDFSPKNFVRTLIEFADLSVLSIVHDKLRPHS